MRLVSLHVRNFRIHLDTAVEFDPERTLIGGPNESGKSTLLEAAHRALFLNHRRGGQDLEGMKSTLASDPPEVELVFDQNGARYHLTKRFKGPSGSHAELRRDDHERWTGNEAEEQLAGLLGFAEAVAPKDAAAQWAHLWIRQGESGRDPAADATRERDALLARLRDDGGAALMQSDRDARVARHFLDAEAALFNRNGSPKAGSPLKAAEDALAAAEETRERKRAAAEHLRQAAEQHRAATVQIEAAASAIPDLETQLAAATKRRDEAKALAEEKTRAAKQHDEAATRHRQLTEADTRIRRLAARLGEMQAAAGPKREQAERLDAARKAAETQDREAAAALEEASGQTRRARQRLDLARARVERFQTDARLADLRKRREQVATLRAELQSPTEALARLPKIEADHLKQLRDLAARRDQAKATLDGLATGIEWLEGDGPASIDGEPLAPGESRVLTETRDLEIGGNRLRIRPGGGNRLDETRAAFHQAESSLNDLLETLGVRDLAEATRCHESRQSHQATIERLKTRLEDLAPESLDAEIEAQTNRRNELDAEIDRLATALEETDPPADAEAAERARDAAAKALSDAESAENTARGTRQTSAERLETARAEADRAAAALRREEAELGEARVQLDTLVETHGDEAARAEAIAAAERECASLKTRTAELDARLAELQPDQIDADLKRLDRSLHQQRETKSKAEREQAAAAATLRSDGSTDPHTELAEAEQAAARARETRDAEHRRAAAVKRLADLFREEQQRLSDRFTEPLAEKIGDYLQCLFGPEARARMALEDGAFGGLELLRPGGPFAFTDLSGGTREQLAAAVRLAMAELLAADHHGCLPVVFDDAFTHSDPARTATLQRMLDLAAARGLQIIILTCTPADYTSLGATERRL